MLSFNVLGSQEISRGFSRFAEDVKDISGAFKEIVPAFYEMERKQFETEGGYGAGGWKPLAPTTLDRKPPGLPILVRSGRLKGSLTGGAGAILDIKPLEMRIGTNVRYARFHQIGTPYMPARPLIKLPEEEKTRWHKIVHRWLVKQMKEAF